MLKEAVMLSLHMAKDPDPQPRNKVLGDCTNSMANCDKHIFPSLNCRNNTEIPDLSLADSL